MNINSIKQEELLFRIWPPHNTMWFPITLLVLVGVAVATLQHDHAWETGREYQYNVRGRTVACLDSLKEQCTGIQLKGFLNIQAKSPQTLWAKLSNPQYAHIHKTLLDGPESEISDQMLEYRPMSMSGKPFEIRLKHGVIRDVLVHRDVPTWELNILKSFVSQLQVDTQGENARKSKSTQIPVDENSSVMFKAMEDSVGGNCEVLYDIMPLSNDLSEEKLNRIPFPSLRDNGQHYEVKKVKNYKKCLQRQIYHHGLSDSLMKEKHNKQNEIVSQYSETYMIISGNLKSFIIQSAETKNQIGVKSETSDSSIGTVYSIIKLILLKISNGSNSKFGQMDLESTSNNLESTGNLVYMYNNPFSDSENRRERQPSISINSAQQQSSENSSESSSGSSSGSSSFSNSGSSSSSSSSSSSEENNGPNSNTYSKAPLHMAPNVPLLPLFVGYKGKSILKSDKIDGVERAQNLIFQIADEMQNHPSQNTLENFTILRNLLRVMNHKQYIELENRVLGKNGKQSSQEKYYNNAWNILRDAVPYAGTGPALSTMKNWLQSGKIKGAEAARLISQIPKIVLEPTPEYVNEFFEMMIDSSVSQQKRVNVSTPLAFAELLRNSHVSRKYSSYNSMLKKNDNEMVERYFSYLNNQVKQGLHGSNEKLQTYIVAMGLTGHPKIIQILEPYLESTKLATNYQRLLMLASLSTLGRTHPNLVRPIFYKLYLDTREDHKIRCLAVQQFIMTDPPAIALLRIAKYTNFDKSNQVNSAVKTMIESVAKTSRPEWRNLAHKARSVRYLLNPTTMYDGSRGYYKDFENWVIQGLSLQSVASDDSQIPLFGRVNVNTIFDSYDKPTVRAEYAVSSIKQLFNKILAMLWQREGEEASEESYQKSGVEKLVQMLKIKPEKLEELEGNIFIDTPFSSTFWSFDSKSIGQSIQMMKDLLQRGYKMESTAFHMNYERTISFPTESGLPFIYTFDMPQVMKFEVEMKEGEKESSTEKRNGVFNNKMISNIQTRFGFLTPFEHQNYIAGIDNNQMSHMPIEYEVKLDMNRRNLALKISPNVPQTQTGSQMTLLHYSTVPFTTRQDVLDLQPLSLDKNTHQVLTSNVHKTTVRKGLFSIVAENMPLFSNKETEGSDFDKMTDKLSQTLQAVQESNDGHYKKLDLLMNTQEARQSEINVNIVYDNMDVGSYDNDNESHETESQSFPALNWPDGRSRRSQIMKGLSKGLQSGRVHVVEISYQDSSQKRHVVSIGGVRSNVDRRAKVYVYWNSQPQENEQETQHKYEVCYFGELQYSPSTPLDFEYALYNPPNINVSSEVYYGKSCQEGTRVVGVGNATRSDELQKALENSNIGKQCLKEIREGNKAARVCQKANEIAQVRDQYEMLIAPAEIVKETVHKMFEFAMRFMSKMRVVENPDNSEKSVDIIVNIPPSGFDFGIVPNIHMRTPQYDVTYPDLIKTTWETQRLLAATIQNKVETDSCTLDKDRLITFDKRTYPVTLGTIKHVLLTTYLQQQQHSSQREHSMTIPEDMRVAILAKDADDGSRVITMLLGNQEVKLSKLNNHLQVMVDGQTVELSKQGSYVNRQNGEVVFEIVMLPDGSSKLSSDRYGISTFYDGERIQILASDKYRDAILGLCGNYDSNGYNDFLTPNNCMLTRAEEFAATYALIQKNSQGPVVENRRKAEQAECQELSSEYQRNVISDGEAGRMIQSENWGYHQNNHKKEGGDYARNNKKHSQGVDSKSDYYQERRNIIYRTRVVEEGNEICFTTRPVPTCVEGTRPTERKSKKYDLYCQPGNVESLAMKHRIEQGANPDFTRKPVSKSHVFQVSSTCSAA